MNWFAPSERAPSAMERMESEIDYLRQQNASLLAYVLNAKPVAPVVAIEPIRPVAPKQRDADVVTEALNTAAGGNAVLRRQLGKYARQEKAAGTPEREIAHTLLNWPEAEDD